MYIWGGGQYNLPQVHNSYQKNRLTSQIEIFNITSGKWDSKPTSGDPPLGVAGYVCTTFKDKIYYFGGWCFHGDCYHNSIFQLDTSTYTWTQLQPTDDNIAVMKRGCGCIMSTEYEGQYRLLMIGGEGSLPSQQCLNLAIISCPVLEYLPMNIIYMIYQQVRLLIYIYIYNILSLSVNN